MRYFVLLIGWIAFYTAVDAQSNLPVIFVKGSYYLLSPSGDLMFNEAFSDVKFDVPFKGQLLVNQIGKVGVIENGQYLFRPEFTSITTLHNDNYGRKGYVLEKNKLYGVADGNGKIIYPIRYTSVDRERDVLSNSKRVLALKYGDCTTVVFQKENQDFQTVYSGIVHAVSVYNGMIRIEQGEKSALWTYDESEDQLVAMLPFTKVKVSCSYNSFQVYDPSKKTVRTYSYSNRLLLEKKNVATFEEQMESADMEGGYDEVQQAVFPEPLILSVDRHDLLTNKNTHVKRFLMEEEVVMNSKWLTRLSEKKVKVEAVETVNETLNIHYIEKDRYNSVRDTMVSIPAAELVKWNFNQTTCLVKHKELMAIYSVDGKELYPFTTNRLTIERTQNGVEWYVVKDKKLLTVLFYNEKTNVMETVLQVPKETKCEMMDLTILLTASKGKKQALRFVKVEPSYSATGSSLKITERNEVFESIEPLKNYPGLLIGKSKGKYGVLDNTGKVLIPCVFDTIQCEAYYDFDYLKKGISMLKPIVKAYEKDSFQLFVAQGDPMFWKFKQSSGYFSNGTIITDDALVVYEPQTANQYLIYTLDGKLLSKVPLTISKPQLSSVSYNEAFWYVFGQDINYKTIVLLSNGKRIELP